MTDLKTGRALTPEELVAQAQHIAALEEECAANRLVKRQMKEMYEAQIESLSRELDAFRTEYLCASSSSAPQAPVRTPSPAAMASSAAAVAALQTRVGELEAELARRDEQQQQQQQQRGSGSGAQGYVCCSDSAIVLEDAQRQLDAALAALDAERRQHALDCAQSAKEEALLRRAAWRARSRELAALAKMRTLALQPELSSSPSRTASVDDDKAAEADKASATAEKEATTTTGEEDESTKKNKDSNNGNKNKSFDQVVEENWALKHELCAVYARMDKLAQMFLCRLDAPSCESDNNDQRQQQQHGVGSPCTEGTSSSSSSEVAALREVLLSGEEERRAARLAAEAARRDVEAAAATVGALTAPLERLCDRVIGTGRAAQEGAMPEGAAASDVGPAGALAGAAAHVARLVGALDAELGRTVASFSLAETLALLRQEKVRLETDVDELRNRCAHHEAERAYAGAALVQFLEADERDRKAVLMKLAELLHLSVQDRERALSRMGAPPVPRSFLSRFSKP